MDVVHVFFVNKGYKFEVELGFANERIRQLQSAIADQIRIRVSDQVLIAAGGQSLDPDRKISEFGGAGNSTTPIFLFVRTDKEPGSELSTSQLLVDVQSSIDSISTELVNVPGNGSADLPRWISLSRPAKSIAAGAFSTCYAVVSDHHFINQGWQALVTNLDDSVTRLQRRAVRSQEHAQKVPRMREAAEELFVSFGGVIEQLQRMRLPGSLARGRSGSPEQSLYDWISSADQHSLLEHVVTETKSHLTKFDSADEVQQFMAQLDFLVRAHQNQEFRDIRGIQKRLAQLEKSLQSLEQKRIAVDELLGQLQSVGAVSPTATDLNERMGRAKQLVDELVRVLAEMRQTSEVFFKSKNELLSNIRTRLSGWIHQSYERLHKLHTAVVVFDEKFDGLRSRLDLVRQLRETPLLFTHAIAELIRRAKFRRELKQWYSAQRERCTTLERDERKKRKELTDRLEKHFLRMLFASLLEDLPSIFPAETPAIDDALPIIDQTYIADLQKALSSAAPPYMSELLTIESPRVWARLALRDPACSASSSDLASAAAIATGNQSVGRARGFSVCDEAVALGSSPGSASLAGGFAATLGMMSHSPSGGRFPSTGSLSSATNAVSPLAHEDRTLVLDDLGTYIPPHSLPISIPPPSMSSSVAPTSTVTSTTMSTMTMMARGSGRRLARVESSDDGGVSQSQRLSMGHFPNDELISRSQTVERLRPVVTELVSIKRDMLEVRDEVLDWQRRQFKSNNEKMTEAVAQMMQEAMQELRQKMETEHQTKVDDLERMLDEERRLSADRKQRIEELEREYSECEKINTRLVVDAELEMDALRAEKDSELQMKSVELQGVQAELGRVKTELERLQLDPSSPDFHKQAIHDARSELEREYRRKAELLAAGLRAKEEEQRERWKKEGEVEARRKLAAAKQIEPEGRQRVSSSSQTDLASGTNSQPPPSLSNELEEIETSMDKTTQCEKEATVEEAIQTSHCSLEKETQTVHEAAAAAAAEEEEEEEEGEARATNRPPVRFVLQEQAEEGLVRTTTEEDMTRTVLMDQSMLKLPAMQQSQIGGEQAEETTRRSSTYSSASSSSTNELQPPHVPAQFPPNEDETTTTTDGVSVAVQTRISQRHFRSLVAVAPPFEDAVVLVVWEEKHRAYVLFCVAAGSIHFVKESSVRRLGLPLPLPVESNRRNWLLARFVQEDLCLIRKSDNRYGLPVNSRVYRAELRPLTTDLPPPPIAPQQPVQEEGPEAQEPESSAR